MWGAAIIGPYVDPEKTYVIRFAGLSSARGLGKLIDEYLTDSRQGANMKFPLADVLRQLVYSWLGATKISATLSNRSATSCINNAPAKCTT